VFPCLRFASCIEIFIICLHQGSNKVALASLHNETKASLLAWRKHSADQRERCVISSDFSGWTSRPGIKLTGVPTLPRALDRLNIMWATRLNEMKVGDTSERLRRDLWVDLSQNPHRGSAAGTPGTLCASSLIYSFEHDCTLDGEDALLLQGWSSEFAGSSEFSTSEKREMAGEGYHIPSFAIVCLSFYLNPYGGWWAEARR
jgi:hypothetical protein